MKTLKYLFVLITCLTLVVSCTKLDLDEDETSLIENSQATGDDDGHVDETEKN